MKKLFVVAIILVCSIIPVFAEGQIGVSVTPEWMWGDFFGSDGQTSLIVSVDGANYFSEAYGFGVEYGLGAYFPLDFWSATETSLNEANVGFVFRLGAGYRYEIFDFFGVAAGLGVTGAYESLDFEDAKHLISNLALYGKIAADFTFIDAIRINVGLAMGGPLYTKSVTSGITSRVDMGNFFLAPFVGVSYVY